MDPAYWVVPILLLGESADAVSIGLINCAGIRGFFGPWVVGHLLASHHSYSLAVVVLSLAFVMGSLFVMSIRVPDQRPSEDADARRNASASSAHLASVTQFYIRPLFFSRSRQSSGEQATRLRITGA